MKICVIANGDPFDKGTWSRTPYNIVSRLEKYPNVQVVPFNIKKELPLRAYKLFCRFWGKVFLIKGSPRDPLVYKRASAILQKKLNMVGADIYLFCAEYCLSAQKTDAKYYNYVDATMRPLIEANIKQKAGSQFFLKRYEVNEKECYRLLDGSFTMNEWVGKSTADLYGFSKEKSYNVGFGVNCIYYDGEKNYDDPHLLIVLRRRTEQRKGLDFLLEAFEIAKQKIPNLRLSVVGTTMQNSVDGVTYWEGYPREKTIELFQKATLYVMPALYEPNGIVYLEALANKTPIIGLNRFSFPEFSGNGKYGFIVPKRDSKMLAETIVKALSNPALLAKMGKEGQAYVKSKYDWDIVVDKMMKRFEQDLSCK